MDGKKPIDSIRNRGGHADIGTLEDGAIMETMNVGGRLIIIKERSVYEFSLADSIDPKRQHPNLPPSTQKLIVNLGTESEIFSRTFLTAKRLFKSEFLPTTIDTTQALFLTLEVVQELAALDSEISDYLNLEKKACDDYEERKNKKLDHAVPSIPDLRTRNKTIFHKVDQAMQAQIALIKVFYPDFNKNSYYGKFHEHIEKKYSVKDDFVKFIKDILPFMELMRAIRNCTEHRRTETKISDFELQTDSNILSPTIEVDYDGNKLEKTSYATFLTVTKENLVTIFENMIAYLCSKNLKVDRIMPGQVLLIPEDRRTNKHIKYAYWSPLGEGGYFHQ